MGVRTITQHGALRLARQLRSLTKRLRSKPHLSATSQELLEGLTAGDTAIDCGANVGDVTEVLSAHGLIVHALEPDPAAFEVLSSRFTDHPNVFCHHTAAWYCDEEVPLFMHQQFQEDRLRFSCASSLMPSKRNIDQNHFVKVQAIDLGRFVLELDKDVALLKLDIEGAEAAVLRRLMQSGALGHIHRVLMETHEAKVPGLSEQLSELFLRMPEGDRQRINRSWR